MLSIYSKNVINNIQKFVDQKLYKITPIESYDFFNIGVYSYGHKIMPYVENNKMSYTIHTDSFVRYYDYKNNCESEWTKQNFREMPILKYLGKDIKKQTTITNNNISILPYVELNSFYTDNENHKDLKIKAILRYCDDENVDHAMCLYIGGFYYVVIKLTLQELSYNRPDPFELILKESDVACEEPQDETDDDQEDDIMLSDIEDSICDAEPLF